ncbi:hypothetical protein LTR86_004745 [Recurvomyces mirabilis]|nr:hypothetical protein LTR86_004745 [Recurvomyces mirabilis]
MSYDRPSNEYDYPRPPYANHAAPHGTVSPMSGRGSIRSFQQNNAWQLSGPPSIQESAPPSPPKRIAQPHHYQAAPRNDYYNDPTSPAPFSRHTNSVSSRGSYASYGVPATAQVGVRVNGRRLSPPMEAYSNAGALRDIDNLYGGRTMITPSPEPQEMPADRPFGKPPVQYAEPKVLLGPDQRAAASQNSVTPLLPAAQAAQPEYEDDGRPHMQHRRSMPLFEAVGMRDSYEQNYVNQQGDGYDDRDDHMPRGASHDFDNFHEQLTPQQRQMDLMTDMPRRVPVASRVPGSARGAGGYAPAPAIRARDIDSDHGDLRGDEDRARKRRKWMVLIIIGCIVAAAAAGAIVGGVLGVRKSNKTHGTAGTGSGSGNSKGLYDINSSQVQTLLNNKNLHRVFPGMDYTPLNAQYPACLTNPPDQNNVTLDVAMLAQLTPAIRLYGTDCNQTEMVLTALNQLNYNSSIQIWLGVWLGNNATTNTRQVDQMYDILSTYPSSHFAGVIVGNEVLFRKDLTEAELGQQLQDVRNNLTAKNIHLPVSSSDLGDDWTAALAADTDIIMSNIHPFFAGVTPDEAPAWANNFWRTHDVILADASASGKGWPSNIISEIGWPSEGGNDCGNTNACANATAGAVASVENMNTFMDGWVCQALANGTTYFWFEAFDEPWKVQFDTDTDKWEPRWGLIDSNRNVKSGLKIPDCGGKTLSTAY